jgi:hypothetical protein
MAFRAIKGFLDNTSGISLVRKPGYAILLDREKGAWTNWRREMREMISSDLMSTEGMYYIEVYGNSLVPIERSIVPLSTTASNLPMVM